MNERLEPMRRTAFLSALALGSVMLAVQPAHAAPLPVASVAQQEFSKFVPAGDTIATRLDFSNWTKALNWFVLRMGRSLREYEPQPDKQLGTHFTYGHDSAYRLEGNRVAFSLMPDDVRQSLTDYRRELESLPDEVPLTRLPRNEQLAYWINLHNVAVIEQLALAYPLKKPALFKPAGSELPLDETRFITVSGVRLSPKDIRTRIVYPNWRDPKVIYGFWHGDIGGPSIARDAYTATNMGESLDYGALEFVNSLRGTQKSGNTLLVSELYLEARPFFFPDWPHDLRAHIKKYAEDEVAGLLATTSRVDARIAETDIADLSKGEREPQLTNLIQGDQYPGINVDPAVARLLTERRDKLDRFYRNRVREGTVTVGQGDDKAKPAEVVR